MMEFNGSEAGVKEQIETVTNICEDNGGTEFKWAEVRLPANFLPSITPLKALSLEGSRMIIESQFSGPRGAKSLMESSTLRLLRDLRSASQ